jgi:hypothetical protein
VSLAWPRPCFLPDPRRSSLDYVLGKTGGFPLRPAHLQRERRHCNSQTLRPRRIATPPPPEGTASGKRKPLSVGRVRGADVGAVNRGFAMGVIPDGPPRGYGQIASNSCRRE